MKVLPYFAEEMHRVLAYDPIGLIKRGICDWCGGPMSPTQPRSAYICTRCWGNRAQIATAIKHMTVSHTHLLHLMMPPDTCTTTRARGRSA